MDENKNILEQELLYDPMFDKMPDITLPDNPDKGLWGKTAFKKALFIVILIVSIGASLFWSFRSVATDKYKFEEAEGSYILHSFRGEEPDKVLSIDYVRDENNIPDKTKVVTSVREYAITCNEYLEFIFISKDVKDVQNISFYSCTALKAIIVDPENENFASVDGVLYKKDNGILTEILLYPVRNGYYRTALKSGITAPESEKNVEAFNKACVEKENEIYTEYLKTGTSYDIPDTVKTIGQLCFSSCYRIDGEKLVYALEHITIPESVKRIETMAFFKCTALKEINIHDKIEYIGSDAFTECKNITYLFIPSSVKEIGHHAFNKCEGIKEVYMGHASKDDIKLGIQWYPQTSKVVMVSVDIIYGQSRQEGANTNG